MLWVEGKKGVKRIHAVKSKGFLSRIAIADQHSIVIAFKHEQREDTLKQSSVYLYLESVSKPLLKYAYQ